MKKSDAVHFVLHNKSMQPQQEVGLAFAPTNIALCKYWGKRDNELNLPVTSSLSISLPDKGAMTSVKLNQETQDRIILNGEAVKTTSRFAERIVQYLDLFRSDKKWFLDIDIKMNLPVAAGLASSACGFAALVCALNDLFGWQLSRRSLSILARLGSGSASRSLWNGFVEWQAGVSPDGMDSFGEPLPYEWQALRIGILSINTSEKPISSRDAMLSTVNSSPLYQAWPKKVSQDMIMIKQAIKSKNIALLGGTAESNALTMHATMLSSWPPVCYFLPETIAAMHSVWALRKKGIEVYFTEDAGPNIKLLFTESDEEKVKSEFQDLDVITKLFD